MNMICICPTWTVLRSHLPPKVMVCIPPCVMPNYIFIPCRWSVVLHLNLSKMRVRCYKIWLGQSSCHPHWLCICFISKTQNEHITFISIHCNMERWWGIITSKPDVMVIHIKLLRNLSISQKASLQSLYIDTNLWQNPCLKVRGLTWWRSAKAACTCVQYYIQLL